MRTGLQISLCVFLLFLSSAPANSQTFTGGIRGVVTDVNGVLPGATVTLTNEATRVSRETVTNEVGQYNFPAVPPASYAIKVQLAGYKQLDRTGVRVATQQFLTLDLMLEADSADRQIDQGVRI